MRDEIVAAVAGASRDVAAAGEAARVKVAAAEEAAAAPVMSAVVATAVESCFWTSEVVLGPPDYLAQRRRVLQPMSNTAEQEGERLPCVRELGALLFGKPQVHRRHDSRRQGHRRQGQRITRQREARHQLRRQQQRLRQRLHVYSSCHETIHPQHQGRNATGRQWRVGIIPRRRTDPRAEGKDAGVQGALNAERDHNRREAHNLWGRHRHHFVHHTQQPRRPTPGQPPRASCTRPRTQHLRPNSRAEERSQIRAGGR